MNTAPVLGNARRTSAPLEEGLMTGGLRDWLGTAATLLGGLALVLAVFSVVQSGANRDLQETASANQAQLQKAQTLATIDNNLVQLLAKAAAEGNDSDIRALLARNGVTFRTRSADPAPLAAPTN